MLYITTIVKIITAKLPLWGQHASPNFNDLISKSMTMQLMKCQEDIVCDMFEHQRSRRHKRWKGISEILSINRFYSPCLKGSCWWKQGNGLSAQRWRQEGCWPPWGERRCTGQQSGPWMPSSCLGMCTESKKRPGYKNIYLYTEFKRNIYKSNPLTFISPRK